MKILIAVDGSACSNQAVNEVARQPWPTGSEVRVINVVETPIVPGIEPWAIPPNYIEELEKANQKSAQTIVDRAVSKLKGGEDRSLKITGEVVEGQPKSAILEIADSWGADLIVVGSRGLGAVRRFLLGSVSHAVALHAKCSVEIVRCPQSDEEEAKG